MDLHFIELMDIQKALTDRMVACSESAAKARLRDDTNALTYWYNEHKAMLAVRTKIEAEMDRQSVAGEW